MDTVSLFAERSINSSVGRDILRAHILVDPTRSSQSRREGERCLAEETALVVPAATAVEGTHRLELAIYVLVLWFISAMTSSRRLWS